MKKQDYISSFEEAISHLFTSGSEKVGLEALRSSILEELQESSKAKKISDAKNVEVLRIKKDLVKKIYEDIVTSFPEISNFVQMVASAVCFGGFGGDSIKILSSYKVINSAIDHIEWSIDDLPFAINRSYESLEELYESDEFRNLIKKYYTKLELGKINTSK